MDFEVLWSEKALKQLRGLEKEEVGRVVEKVNTLETEPYIKTLGLTGCNFRRLRVGDLRVILEIVSEKRKVKILLLGKRENIYEGLKEIV